MGPSCGLGPPIKNAAEAPHWHCATLANACFTRWSAILAIAVEQVPATTALRIHFGSPYSPLVPWSRQALKNKSARFKAYHRRTSSSGNIANSKTKFKSRSRLKPRPRSTCASKCHTGYCLVLKITFHVHPVTPRSSLHNPIGKALAHAISFQGCIPSVGKSFALPWSSDVSFQNPAGPLFRKQRCNTGGAGCAV